MIEERSAGQQDAFSVSETMSCVKSCVHFQNGTIGKKMQCCSTAAEAYKIRLWTVRYDSKLKYFAFSS